MKVFSVYINDTDGHIMVCANNEGEIMELILNNEDSPLFERDMEDQTIDFYVEDTLITTHTLPTIINYMIVEDVNF